MTKRHLRAHGDELAERISDTEKTIADAEEITLTDEEIEEMVRLRSDGRSLREIAEEVRVFDQLGRAHKPSPAWICRVLKEHHSERDPPNQGGAGA